MDLLTTLHTLQRDKPGARLMAATGLDLRDRLAYDEEHVQVIPKA